MIRRLFLSIALLLLYDRLPAQVGREQSWQTWSNTSLPDSVRLDAIQRLATGYSQSNPDSARMLAEIQRSYAQEKGWVQWEARALNVIGLSYRFQSDFSRALQYYEQSIALLEKIGDKRYMSAVYGNMGDVYRVQSKIPKAIDCVLKAQALAEESGDQKRAADAYVSIAIMYFDLPNSHDKILSNLEKAQVIYEALKFDQGLAGVYANLTTVYFDQKDLSNAQFYVEKALAIQEKKGDLYGMATSLYNRACIRNSLGQYEPALADFNRVAEYFQRLGDQEGLADTYNGIGDLWIKRKQYPRAVEICTKALQIAREIGSPNLKETEACQCLHSAYQKQGKYKQALEYLEAYMASKDSLQQSETAEKLKQMELAQQAATDSLSREKERFQVELSHQQTIRRKDQIVGLLIAVALGVLIAALAFWLRMLYFRRRSQQLEVRSENLEKQQLLNEIALLRTQVNPHFLFNSLSILSSLVHQNADLSEQFIDQLSRSYRYILEQKEQSLVSIRTELEFIQSYAFLLKIRFEKKFDLRIQLSDQVQDHYRIAPLTLQLLVENAVKHNRMSAQEPLVVEVLAEGDFLIVKNPLRLRPQRQDSTGTGLNNIIHRYALLTDRAVWAGECEDAFVVKVPLIPN